MSFPASGLVQKAGISSGQGWEEPVLIFTSIFLMPSTEVILGLRPWSLKTPTIFHIDLDFLFSELLIVVSPRWQNHNHCSHPRKGNKRSLLRTSTPGRYLTGSCPIGLCQDWLKQTWPYWVKSLDWVIFKFFPFVPWNRRGLFGLPLQKLISQWLTDKAHTFIPQSWGGRKSKLRVPASQVLMRVLVWSTDWLPTLSSCWGAKEVGSK